MLTTIAQFPIQVVIAVPLSLLIIVFLLLKNALSGGGSPRSRSLYHTADPRSRYLYPAERKQSGGFTLLVLILLLMAVLYMAWPLIGKRVHLPSLQGMTQQLIVKTSPVVHDRRYYINVTQQDARDAGILPWVFMNQIKEESNFDPRARSAAGAEGIAQFMPQTAKALGIDPWNPEQSLLGAARVMARYLHLYGGDYAKALATYNAGSKQVVYAIQQGGLFWRTLLPTETQHYLTIILGA